MKEMDHRLDEIAGICSDCGNCLFACPVYNAELSEPNAPRGKINLIKAVRDGRLEANKLNKQFISRCLLCGSCQHICTRGVEFVPLMIEYRNSQSGGKRIPLVKKAILFLYQSFIFKKMGWFWRLLSRSPLKKKWTIPTVKNIKLKKWITPDTSKKYDILLFPGCVLTSFYSHLVGKIMAFLEANGFSVALPGGLKCCGFPYLTQGWEKRFDTLQKKNSKIFSSFQFKYLLVPCGTGTFTFKEFYPLKGVEVVELTEFVYRFMKESAVKMEAGTGNRGAAGEGQKITYHHPCHHQKSLGLGKEARFFLEQYGEKFVDDASSYCCGFGGLFSIGFPSTSKKILDRKRRSLRDIGADTVVTSCPGCYLQLKENLPQEVRFFIELFSPDESTPASGFDA